MAAELRFHCVAPAAVLDRRSCATRPVVAGCCALLCCCLLTQSRSQMYLWCVMHTHHTPRLLLVLKSAVSQRISAHAHRWQAVAHVLSALANTCQHAARKSFPVTANHLPGRTMIADAQYWTSRQAGNGGLTTRRAGSAGWGATIHTHIQSHTQITSLPNPNHATPRNHMKTAKELTGTHTFLLGVERIGTRAARALPQHHVPHRHPAGGHAIASPR